MHVKKSYIGLLAGCIIISISSCDLFNPETTPPEAGLYFINAVPDGKPFDAFYDGDMIINNLNYSADTGYVLIQPGTHRLSLSESGTNDYFINSYISFNPAANYSLFLADSAKKRKLATFQNKFKLPGTDSLQLIFLNLSPNSPALNAVLYMPGDTLRYIGRAFNDQSSDTLKSNPNTAKAGNYSLDITRADNSAVASFDNISLAAGKFYTIYLKGFYDSSAAQAVDTSIVRY